MIMADYPPSSAAYQPVYQQIGESSGDNNLSPGVNYYQFDNINGGCYNHQWQQPSVPPAPPTTISGQIYYQTNVPNAYFYQPGCGYQDVSAQDPSFEYYISEEAPNYDPGILQQPHQSSSVLPIPPPFSSMSNNDNNSQALSLPPPVDSVVMMPSQPPSSLTHHPSSSNLSPPLRMTTLPLTHLPAFSLGVTSSNNNRSGGETLSPVKLSRLEARRKRNREAAQRCRTNRMETIKRLEKEREELMGEIEQLRSLVSKYEPRVKEMDESYLQLTERHYCLVPFKKAT